MVTPATQPASNPKAEIRRCQSCGSPTLVCFNAWQHSFSGHQTGRITRDCRCQTCGKVVILHDPTGIKILWVVGFVLLLTIFPGVLALLLAWSRSRAWKNNPIVPGTAYPEIRHRIGPGDRRCSRCGKSCKLTSVTRHRHNGVPTGTDYEYECSGCGYAFKTESVGGIVFSVFIGLFFMGCGYALLQSSAESAGLRYGGGIGAMLASGFLIFQAGKRAVLAMQNPQV
jgi:hypothetical protein